MRELLAGRAIGDLALDETAALASLAHDEWDAEQEGLEAAVGSTYIGFAAGMTPHSEGGPPEPVPEDVMHRLQRLAEAYISARDLAPPAPRAIRPVLAPLPPRRAEHDRIRTHHAVGSGGLAESRASRRARAAWAAAAAGVLLAAVGWGVALRGDLGALSGPAAPGRVLQQVRAQPDAVTIPWSEWSDGAVTAEVQGVTGEVVWSDQAQSGVMRLAGLPALPGSVYQLWIIDAERGMSQRISGGIFSGGGPESLIIIEPRLRVERAAAFAITIEQPGGTWVSDMSRRAVIAARPS